MFVFILRSNLTVFTFLNSRETTAEFSVLKYTHFESTWNIVGIIHGSDFIIQIFFRTFNATISVKIKGIITRMGLDQTAQNTLTINFAESYLFFLTGSPSSSTSSPTSSSSIAVVGSGNMSLASSLNTATDAPDASMSNDNCKFSFIKHSAD